MLYNIGDGDDPSRYRAVAGVRGGQEMFTRILVAIDGSPISDPALQTAFKLAADRSAKVRMVHVVDVLPPAGLGAEYMDYGAY